MSVTEPLFHWPSGRLSDVEHMITHSFHWQNTNAQLLEGIGDGCLSDELHTNVYYKLWALSTLSSYNHDTLLLRKSRVPYTHQSYIQYISDTSLIEQRFYYPDSSHQLSYHIFCLNYWSVFVNVHKNKPTLNVAPVLSSLSEIYSYSLIPFFLLISVFL